MNDRLQTQLKQLRLSGLATTLDIRLQEAAGNNLTHAEFLELILQDELLIRNQRQIGRRVKTAQFREQKTLDQFNWSFNPSIPRKQLYDLASCRYLRERRDVLLLGPPGVGKSFLVQALGHNSLVAGSSASAISSPGARPARSMASSSSLIASSFCGRSGAKPPSSPTAVDMPRSFRMARNAW
jgi:DNA replication protein DnaC